MANEQQQPDGELAIKSGTNQQQPTDGGSKKKRPIFSKSLGTAAGLSKLLPTGTTLAFQTMAPSFTRGGECEDHDVNFAFTCGLIVFLTLLTAALNFTDSVLGADGNTHYGVATGKRLRLFNNDRELVNKVVDRKDLRRRRLRPQDVLHAVVSAGVFLALAFCDAGVQRCLVRRESQPWKDFFTHLPLAVGFLATFLFIIFPTNRKGIGEDGAWGGGADDGHDKGASTPAGKDHEAATAPNEPNAPAEAAVDKDKDDAKNKKKALEERKATTLLGAAATLSKLLPTGTTLAFQTMAPSFTNGGYCAGHRVNVAFTWGLIGVLTVMCAAVTFTDSVTDPDGNTHYGLATPRGFWLFNGNPRHLRGRDDWERLRREKKIRARDFLHAVVSAAVFVTVAFCDAGVQGCLVPEESTQWRQFLALLPLAVAFLASFLFVVFPSDRKGIGEEGDYWWHMDEVAETTKKEQQAGPPTANESAAISVARVAPSDVVQLDNNSAV